ncbi:MAG: S49 family peptidase, partial [Nitrososphaera sp.]
GLPAHGVIEEFRQAADSIRRDPSLIPIWQPIIAKYPPTFIGECQKALAWSNEMVQKWLETGMFNGDPKAKERATKIVSELGDHALTKSHSRHLSADRCKEIGLVVEDMEKDQTLQDAILTVHHICMLTLTDTAAFKIIENHRGKASIQTI